MTSLSGVQSITPALHFVINDNVYYGTTSHFMFLHFSIRIINQLPKLLVDASVIKTIFKYCSRQPCCSTCFSLITY